VPCVPPLLRKTERQRDEPQRDEDEHRDDDACTDASQSHRSHEPRRAPGEHDERDHLGHEMHRPEHVHESLVARGATQLVRREEPMYVEAADVEARRNARAPEERGRDEPAGQEND